MKPFAATSVALLLSLASCAATARLEASLESWRQEATRVRELAENDIALAYEDAKRLQESLPIDATLADRTRALNVLSRVETYIGLTEPADEHARQAFEFASRNRDKIGQAEADLNVALNSVNQGRLDVLVTATTRALSELEGSDRPELLAEALLRTAVMYRRFEQFDESVAVAVQAMEIARRSGNPTALAFAHHCLAIGFDQSFRRTEARQHYVEMREQARKAHSLLLEGLAVAGMASVSTEGQTGEVTEAEALHRQSIEIFRRVGAPFAESFAHYGLGRNLLAQHRTTEALSAFQHGLAVFEKYPNRIGAWFALNAISEAREALGQHAAAQADAERAYAVAKDLGLALYMSGSALRLAAIASAAHDYRRAYELSVEAREMTARATREKASARVVQLTTRYESESKQREINELTRRNEQQTAELRQRELQQRWMWTVLAGSLMLLIVTAFFMLRLRRSKNAIRALNTGLEQRVQERTAELRQQALYLRTLIDMLPMWTWFKDTRGRYLVTNQAHADARGCPADAMIGKTDADLLPPALARVSESDDAEVMASRGRKTTEETTADDQRQVWMETYKAAVLDEDGSVLGTVGVARDINDRKATEAARERALGEARRLAQMRSDFLAQMSHELRTPLNGILGFAQILRGDQGLNERQARAVSTIEQSGQHLLALINDVLDVARVDAGKLELVASPFDLRACVQVVAEIVRVKADEKNLIFLCDVPPRLPDSVLGDEMRLRQVLLNLLSNAVKFTDRGRVELRISCTPQSADGSVRVRFEVEDSGIGMTPEELSRLFQPFEQLGDAQRRAGGTGLGLAISRRLVHLMGGEIQVSSEPGRGSCFRFETSMVAAFTPGAQAARGGTRVGYKGWRRRILVVDDSPPVRTLLTEVLSPLGFEVHEAPDGEEGLRMALAMRPDLIIMDLTMPNMDGMEATRRLRASAEAGNTPVIVTSANADPATARAARQAGADAFMTKPIQHDELLGSVGDLLSLEWTRAGGEGRYGPAETRPPAIVVELPPPDELAELQRLARVGSMRDIRARADYLCALSPRYAAFAMHLRSLAEGYQSRAIAALVEGGEKWPGTKPGL